MANYCGVCLSEDYVGEGTAPDGRPILECTNPFHPEPRVWEKPPIRRANRGDSIGQELGIWDKLLDCVEATDDFEPYGAVEDRFADRFPEEMARLIGLYGHRWRDPEHPSDRYSASIYLSARLADLTREGLVEHRTGPAEGPWAYNGTYEWWRKRG